MSNKHGIPDKTWEPPLVTLETSLGSFDVELYWKHAPNSCRNFAELSRRGYYNGTIFHRVIRDFCIQGGDPTRSGRGGSSIYGATFDDDEISNELKHTGAGVIAMANAGPNTNSSQFYITLAPCQHLDNKHTTFGRIRTGMNVIRRIGMVETNRNDDRPLQEVEIINARISEAIIVKSVRRINDDGFVFGYSEKIEDWKKFEE